MNNKMFWGMTATILALVATVGGSFVGIKKIQNIKSENHNLRIENTLKTEENEKLKIDIVSYQRQLINTQSQVESLNEQITGLNAQIKSLQEELTESSDYNLKLESRECVLNDIIKINSDYLGQDYYYATAKSNLIKLSESDSESSFSMKENLKFSISFNDDRGSPNRRYVSVTANEVYGNDSAKKFARVFKINGTEVSREEFNENITNIEIENCVDPELQVIINLQRIKDSDGNISVNVVLDIVNFPLTGRYSTSYGNNTDYYIDFDNQVSFMDSFVEYDRFTLVGLVNSNKLTLKCYEKTNPSFCFSNSLTIVSDTEIGFIHLTLTKVTDLIPDECIGTYYASDGSTFTIDSTTLAHTPSSDKLILSTIESSDIIFTLRFLGSEQIIMILQMSDVSFDLYYGNTVYTKQSS